MVIPGQTNRVERVPKLLGEVSGHEGACSKATSSAGGIPRGIGSPPYPAIKLVTLSDELGFPESWGPSCAVTSCVRHRELTMAGSRVGSEVGGCVCSGSFPGRQYSVGSS